MEVASDDKITTEHEKRRLPLKKVARNLDDKHVRLAGRDAAGGKHKRVLARFLAGENSDKVANKRTLRKSRKGLGENGKKSLRRKGQEKRGNLSKKDHYGYYYPYYYYYCDYNYYSSYYEYLCCLNRYYYYYYYY